MWLLMYKSKLDLMLTLHISKLRLSWVTSTLDKTWRYLKKIPLKENNKIQRGHRLQNIPRNPLKNTSKCVNHPVIIGKGATWSPWYGNETIHIPQCNWTIFSAPGPSPISSSSANRCGCSWNSKVHPASCSPSGPMASNGKCGRYPEAATFSITGG